MNRTIASTGILLVGIAMTGCASHNYDFSPVPGGASRIDRLVRDLDQFRAESGDADEDLYDLRVIPFVHSRLHVFGESDEDKTPAGFVEAEFESSLPLFGFVEGEVNHYDEQRQLITRHEFASALWGAFRNHRELVVTHAGTRERTRHSFLWLFSWTESEKWHPASEPVLGSVAAR